MFSSTTRMMAVAAGLAVATLGIDSDAQAQDRYLTGGLLGGALGAAIGGAAGGGTGAGIGAAAGIGAGLLGAHLSRGDDEEERRRQAYQQQQQQQQYQGTPAPQAYQQGYQQPQGTYQAPPADAAVVRDVQTELSALGYDVGAIDGQMSPMTINAIQSYEYNNNLLMTGQVSPQLLDHIRRKRAAMSGQQPVPTPTDSAQGQPSYATQPQSTAGASPGQTASSENCRQVTQTLNVDGKDVVKNVTACRQSDGTWKITE